MADEPTLSLVVVGLGYVGLALAVEAARAGLEVSGLDKDVQRVEALNSGSSYVSDVTDEQVREILRHGFAATDQDECLATADVVVICVPTPLRDALPDLSAVRAVGESLAGQLRSGALVVLESTSYPGTTQEILLPILERGGNQVCKDFCLAFSPERLDPGNNRFALRNIPKIVGGVTEKCTCTAVAFYERFVDKVVKVSSPSVAEMAKLLENTYRQVNIALVNELAMSCHEIGIDIWEVIRAAGTKPFGFQAFYPGPGVGGHCIPIDPTYLTYRITSLGLRFKIGELAQEINKLMPAFVAERIRRILVEKGCDLRGSRILLLGVTYKANVADERESPARAIAELLVAAGADVGYHDPYVPEWSIGNMHMKREKSLTLAVTEADLVVLLQGHSCYDLRAIAEAATLLFDTRGLATGEKVIRL